MLGGQLLGWRQLGDNSSGSSWLKNQLVSWVSSQHWHRPNRYYWVEVDSSCPFLTNTSKLKYPVAFSMLMTYNVDDWAWLCTNNFFQPLSCSSLWAPKWENPQYQSRSRYQYCGWNELNSFINHPSGFRWWSVLMMRGVAWFQQI